MDISTGLPLHGKDAQLMADLAERLAEEQQQFIRAQWLDAEDAPRFQHMDPRVEAQLQARPLPSIRLSSFNNASRILQFLRHHSLVHNAKM